MSHRFLYLLLSQLALVVLYPALGDALTLRLFLEIILLVALFGGILATIADRRRLLISASLGSVFLATRWAALFDGHEVLLVISFAAGAAFFAYVAAVMTWHIFMVRERVDTDLIIGSISVYLLLGAAFGFAFMALNALTPGAFSGVTASTGDPDIVVHKFIYFSFVTLTTLGYGDITPASQQAGVLAYIEAIIGQIYLAVLVARLIGLHIAQKSGSG